ncbi:MAG: pilus assembly protein PilM [Planctomycetes bacterium]|nr:pilus assembly protein PilM [Planctomycetota bacterium]
MPDKSDILILEAGTDELRLSLVRPAGEQTLILDSCSFITKEKHDDRTALQDQNLVDEASVAVSDRNWVGKEVVCILGGGAVSCQYFDMPVLSGPALRQAVTLKLGQQLHFPAAEAVIDIKTIASPTAATHNQIRVAVTAVRQDAAQAAVDATTRLGLRIVALTSTASALSALAAVRLEASEELRAVLHFGERTSTLSVLRGKSPVVTSELQIGMDDFTKAPCARSFPATKSFSWTLKGNGPSRHGRHSRCRANGGFPRNSRRKALSVARADHAEDFPAVDPMAHFCGNH